MLNTQFRAGVPSTSYFEFSRFRPEKIENVTKIRFISDDFSHNFVQSTCVLYKKTWFKMLLRFALHQSSPFHHRTIIWTGIACQHIPCYIASQLTGDVLLKC